MKKTAKFPIGSRVTHTVPSMMYHQTGIVIGDAGKKYGIQYFDILYTNPNTQQACKTSFAEFVLKGV